MSNPTKAGLTDREVESWKAKRKAAAAAFHAGRRQISKGVELSNRALQSFNGFSGADDFGMLCEEGLSADLRNGLTRINDAIALLKDARRGIKDADQKILQAHAYRELEQARAKIAQIEV